ncbi:hypothetical protein MKY19_22750 [Paenibacillus sp. FSL R5-0744]|uniref:hypothetical protein n=1 Tax=Paenibacillus sp. FSL R5-0744 TaxID=2921656 RepID=UPI0030D709AC
MCILRKTTAALLTLLVSIASFTGIVTASASISKKLSVDVISNYSSLLPGQSVMVSVKISNIPSDHKGLRSAKIAVSYDENVFSSEDNIRFDKALGKYIWRDDNFFIPSKTFETADYHIDNPYPEDFNPADGRKEVVLSMSALNSKMIDSTADEAFISFSLTVKNEVKIQNTLINIVSEGTMLQDTTGASVHSYGTTSKQLLVGAPTPKRIEIVRGTISPSSDPFKLIVNNGYELNALAIFDNGDTAYVTEQASWETTDPQVIATLGRGSLQTIGLGNASVMATLGTMTGKHEVRVYLANAPELIEKPVVYYGIQTKIPNEKSFAAAKVVQIKVNGKTAEPGRLFDSAVFVPLRSVSKLLGVDTGYDSIKKLPTIDGKTIANCYTFSGVSYIIARNLTSLLGADMQWDKNKTTLMITSSAKKQ